jgi:hypothetical protein
MRFRRRTSPIPDPGQQVRLLGRRGRLRGRYRTISGPLTDPKDGVVIWVAEEREYREASREGRRSIGMPSRASDGGRLAPGGGPSGGRAGAGGDGAALAVA